MKIKSNNNLTIADLKSALDFTLLLIDELKIKFKDDEKKYFESPAYRELKEKENTLYNELLNKVDDIFI